MPRTLAPHSPAERIHKALGASVARESAFVARRDSAEIVPSADAPSRRCSLKNSLKFTESAR